MTASPATDLQRHQRQQQRIGARGHTDAEPAPAIGGHARLELLDRGPQDEVLAGANLLDGCLHLGRQRLVLQLQIQQRHLHLRRHFSQRHGWPFPLMSLRKNAF